MKKAIIILLGMALLLTGCAPAAPAGEESVQSQTQSAQMENKLSSETDSLSTLKLPEKFTGDWTGLDDCFIVHADATVQMPDGPIPTATVERKSFSQADADKLLEVLLKGNTLYQTVLTKQDCQEWLENLEARQRGEIPMGDASPESLEKLIPDVKAQMETAPDESEIPTASTIFQVDERGREVIEGTATVDGEPVYISIENSRADDTYPSTECHFTREQTRDWVERGTPTEGRTPMECTITEKEAIQLVDDMMEELGVPSMVCDQIREVQSDEAMGYELEFVRSVGSFPLSRLGASGGATPDNANGTAKTWSYEQVRAIISDEGVEYFYWLNPYTEPVIQTENVQLLPFEDIAEVFSKMIFVTNDHWRQANEKSGFDIIHNIDVDKVELNLLRIRDKDSTAEGTIVPVWDFWATTKTRSADEEHRDLVHDGEYYEVVLTINAIDGTVIDRAMGY